MIDITKAERVKTFIRNLKFSKGIWAGEPFNLLSWQEDLIDKLFGTLRPDGLRQYRTAYLEIPKKSGKSELAAAIALYMLCADEEKSPEVYLAASDREQASIVYQAAATMVSSSVELSRRIKRVDSRKRLIYPKKNGFLQTLSSESYTKHGLSPSAVIVDEIHAHPSGDLYETLTSGTDYARSQQLVMVLTTAGVYNRESIWWHTRSKAIQIQQGIIEQPNFLPVLYIADKDKDDPRDEEVWKRVNPSLGQIFTIDKIREDFESVKNDPVEYQNFLRFRLNIPITSLVRFWPSDKWEACAGKVDMASLKGRTCYGGMDLAQTIDLSAFVLVFPPENDGDLPIIVPRFYCPVENIHKRSRTDKVHYDVWANQGYLIATPGETIDLQWIKRDIVKAHKDFNLVNIRYDKKFADHLANELANDHGIEMVEMPQLAKHFNEPMNDLLKEVISGRVLQDGNPVLRWNFDNLVVTPRPDGSIQPDKSKATEKIDGAVATFMAWKGMMAGNQKETSAYEGLTKDQILKGIAF
jgi:phage terminase large subunit-like protein